jgi:hypothetical protein
VARASLIIALIGAACATLAITLPARASDRGAIAASTSSPALLTNEHGIVEARRSPDGLAVSNPRAVFDFVLGRLPARVKVYPTENYYYFSFLHGGVSYAGNIRLDAGDRDLGKVHFGYARARTPWTGRGAATHLLLTASDGVMVEKLDRLVYRVSNGAASVVFELNDLSGVKPPRAAVLPGEQYLGPVFDESGIRFFLMFNARAKVFHYVLDEAGPLGDRLAPTGISDRIHVGMRTGFAFYDDHRTRRKILVGVYAENERLNNYYDGPFDQLPDNFIEGEELRRAILAVEPGLAGRIGRLGHFRGGAARYAIAPYVRYRALADLAVVERCATAKATRAVAYAACFATGRVDTGQ